MNAMKSRIGSHIGMAPVNSPDGGGRAAASVESVTPKPRAIVATSARVPVSSASPYCSCRAGGNMRSRICPAAASVTIPSSP